ncbi:uncharacterized protein N7458_004701 [Penicillium daleae]|uniref:Uncharacterized protein n=1 Tax=Penicillium daleae TaxID=63821 RepID=A0AAD6G441_9EURO|nr:uncharacterized protein N7458_004701 [Penicillium daleae]KAJ5453745.1 hypothetical protein N7458_004701 [Penicillium daleae]
MSDPFVSKDDASSVYSRSPESPKLPSLEEVIPPFKFNLPEINTLDHQLAMSHGTSMALETTRSRLQRSKSRHRMSLPELRDSKLRQWEQQWHENEFYASCRENFLSLSKAALEVSQQLILQYHFEPEVNPVGNIRLLQAIQALKASLDESKRRELEAEQNWKREWRVIRIQRSRNSWI